MTPDTSPAATEETPVGAVPVPVVARHALVVLGMHRSGTSALAGMLARLGADLPARQMVPTPDNPKGYYEFDPLRLLNDRILASAGSSWDDWTRIPQGWYSGPRAPAFHAEARAMLASEFGDSPFFVFKDPRVCRLWPFWRNVLAADGITPFPILALRHPLEVADSLSRRYSIAPSLARLIGLRHQLDAEYATRGTPRVFVRYDQVLSDWRSVITRIKSAAGFAMPRRSPATEAEVDDFLTSSLRRYTHDISDLSRHPGLPAFMVSAEQVFARLASGDLSDASAELDTIEAELAGLAPLFHDIGHQALTRTRELARLTADHQALTVKAEDLTNLRTTQTAKIAELTAERDRLTAERNKLTGERDKLVVERDRLTGERDKLTGERDKRSAELAERVRELAQLARLTAERETQFAAQAKASLKEQEARILKDVFSSLSWRLTAPLRGMSRLYRGLRRR